MNNATQALKDQLRQLKALHQTGALTAAHYGESKAALERRLVDLIVDATDERSAPAQHAKPGAKLVAALCVGVVSIAVAGYWMTRSPSAQDLASTPGSGTEAPHATDSDQMVRMTEQLALRMQEQPADADGWSMLARSYSVLGKHPEALKAYEKAVALRKDDAALLADYADSLAVQNNRSMAGKPLQLVEAALKIDPRNLKALALAGTSAFDRKDYARAIRHWEQAVQFGPPGHPMVAQLESALAEARGLAGLPTAEKQAPSGATVSGVVTLAPGLVQQAQPQDTVFIFARAAEGSRMPLAILRKQVRDLPFQFALDDATAMSPANTLSTVTGKVIVGARISKTGNATPQPGDLSGQSAPVGVGTSGLQIDIKDVVKP